MAQEKEDRAKASINQSRQELIKIQDQLDQEKQNKRRET
jgi:hypothetical protein